MEELKHVCRLCNKRYPSGKSLGGHMRSHVIAGHYVSVHKIKKPKKNNNGDQKKKALDSAAKQERICKQCGKSFQSLKALCGHMSCHSDKGRNFSRFDEEDEEEDEDGYKSWASEDEELESHDSISLENGCSSNLNSEIEQEEQEELALCLMMLSRDSGNRIGFNLSTESSDNNSFILESGSSPQLVNKRKNLDFVPNSQKNSDGFVKKMNLDSEMDNSDSGYFENGAKELESVDSADGYAGNYTIKKAKLDFGSETDMRSKKNDQAFPNSPYKAGKYKCSVCEKSFKTHQALGGHIITHRRDSNGIRYQEHGESSANTRNLDPKNKISNPRVMDGDSERRVGFESKKAKSHCCPFCPKVFRSGQALGGHKRSHLMGCSSQDKANLIQSAQENPVGNQHPFLDLNLPAPADEDG